MKPATLRGSTWTCKFCYKKPYEREHLANSVFPHIATKNSAQVLALLPFTRHNLDVCIYIYISAGPNGAHGCAALLFSLVFLLSRQHAIYCQVSILLSCVKWYSSSIAKVLKGFFWFFCNCLLVTKSHGRARSGTKNHIALNHPGTESVCFPTPNIPHGHLAAFGVAKQSI